jgi:hypothetical protein
MSAAISASAQPQVWTGASGHGASHGEGANQKLSSLFDSADQSGSGSVTQDQLASALQSAKLPKSLQSESAAQIFAKLDSSGTGSVSKQDFISGMKDLLKQARQAEQSSSVETQASSASPSGTGSGVDVYA